MIGTGIFVLPCEAYGITGPTVVFSPVVAGVISPFVTLLASEFSIVMPKAGRSYCYVNHALGPLFDSAVGMGN